ncbi:sigma-70 family RNA polymerase sigma factor [Rheinheimera riviphila]|uniref:Sigma-70 family RNA polymerase sigma factor n=1 Tax=Rheinheimera riviphila TaxID=1834037 RepID=A0A437QSB0_9GAMM|nr:sigma-70 family RNA polymerase sigma factor [Rheinheimera riviphila]RVU37349.1 sigma-70 family RNA polymerase sigma factor [Rheinheimera riviphila]
MPILQSATALAAQIEQLYQQHSRQVLATLIRLLGDFDRAEDALQEAFSAALVQWPQTGVPASPVPWLISTGRFKAIDKLRQQQRFVSDGEVVLAQIASEEAGDSFALQMEQQWPDDYLRLVFTCCHPALSLEAQLALTLREVCGLTTEQIARAFLQTPSTIAQRIVRAKQKIKAAAIPYQVPPPQQLAPRLQAVHKVIYLLFNEGYSMPCQQSAPDDGMQQADLAQQAIDLARQLLVLHFDTESCGLLALLLLQHARRQARFTARGELILLADQQRQHWDQAMITEGIRHVETALSSGRIGAYAIQAAIAAVHSESPDSASTDWPQIHALYQLLYRLEPTPVVALNQLVAFSMCHGPAAALMQLAPLLADEHLAQYHLLFAVAADFHRQLGQNGEAINFYRQALALATTNADEQFLQQRLQDLAAK